MKTVIVNNKQFRVRSFIIDLYGEPVEINVATKSLADEIIKVDVEEGSETDKEINSINFFVNDEYFKSTARELCENHLGEKVNFVKEII